MPCALCNSSASKNVFLSSLLEKIVYISLEKTVLIATLCCWESRSLCF